VSSFGINLDLSVRGQEKFQRAIRTVEQLETAVKRASKELDLSGKLPGRGAEADKIGTLTKRMNDLAKKLVDTGESGKTTQAGISDLTNSFKSLARISDVTKGSFKNFVEATVVAEKEVEKLARAEENARRAFLGMQTLEEREAQLERRANTLRNLRTRKKLKEQEARAREENARAIKREADAAAKLNRQNERDAKLARQRKSKARGRAIGDLAASVGFPLLFGGGIGSVAGGAIGSIAGSAAGIGFGGQILGSALGQALDQAAQAANQFATTLTSATSSVDQLIDAVGVRRTGTATSARFAQTLGIGGVARAGLQSELADIVGDKGVKSLEALADSSAEAANSVSQFGAKITAGFAPALTAINKTISAVLGGSPAVQRLEQKEKDLAGLKEAGSQGFAIKRLEAEIAQLRRDSSEELARHAELQEAIKQVTDGMVGLEDQALRLEQSKLTARRDGLAFAQGNLAVDRLKQDLLVVELELQGDITDERREQLKLQERILGVQIQTAEAARNNAAELARRQIQKEQMSGAVNQIKAIRKEQQLELQYQQGREGRFALFEQEIKLLDAEFVSNGLILDIERKKALVGVTEAERISSINRDYDLRVRLLKKEFDLNKQNLVQADAAYKLSRLQVEQALEMERMQAGISAAQQIRATSPFEREAGLLDPFFGDSSQLQVEQALRYDESLALLNQRLSDVVEQQSKFLAPEVRQQLEDQEKKIRNQIAAFKEYQPAIDAAALAQARFNEAMAITVPVTDAVFDNLLAVAEGTKTAEQAFADFLRSIASMLADAAKQIIATYIAIGIARMFAGVPAKSGPAPDIQQGTGALQGERIMIGGMRTAASGKGTLMNQPYLVGERGPELFVPRSNGTIVPNHQMSAGANVTVNVDASGSSVEGDSDRAEQLGNMLASAVQAELVKQKRPGGLLAS
jgi:uncharacterized protein YcfJ